MKITVKIDNIEISIDEQDNTNSDGRVTLRYSDQNRQVQETIKVMTEECIKLKNVSNQIKSN
jgi:hypothetical protein